MAEIHSTTEYRDIPGYPGYRAGSDGSVWSCWGRGGPGSGRFHCITDKWRQLKPWTNDRGYPKTAFKMANAKERTLYIHHLILETFVGPRPEKHEARHLDGNPLNSRLSNLAWGTKAENEADKKKHANYPEYFRLYTHDGRTLPLAEWARILGMTYSCLHQRVYKSGMSFEQAITCPAQKDRVAKHTLNGQSMTLPEWSEHLGIPYGLLQKRMWKQGLTFEEAVNYKKYSGRGRRKQSGRTR